MIAGTVIVDASFCALTHAAGWAACVSVGADHHQMSRAFDAVPISNVEAEEMAIINGIALALNRGARHVTVYSDCVPALAKINKGNEHIQALYNRSGIPFEQIKLVREHIKGHTNKLTGLHGKQRWCDKQAREAMRDKRKQLGYKRKVNTDPNAGKQDNAMDWRKIIGPFKHKMHSRMGAAEAKGQHGWDVRGPQMREHLQKGLMKAVEDGDYVSIANYSMMLEHRRENDLDQLPSAS